MSTCRIHMFSIVEFYAVKTLRSGTCRMQVGQKMRIFGKNKRKLSLLYINCENTGLKHNRKVVFIQI